MQTNVIYNEDCIETMRRIEGGVNVVITSPPYNTSRTNASDSQKNFDTYQQRYDSYLDGITDEQYCDWTTKVFDGFDKVLTKNGCVLYNISYGSENPNTMWLAIAEVLKKTNFMIADCIAWKKKAALPNNTSPNKLTRIIEFIFVLCRKSECETFYANKEKTKVNSAGQQYYENVFNFIEAPNNDENCPIHKATYSTMLCRKLMLLYTKEGDIVYDPFMGTGTTAVACIKENRRYIGSEISKRYCDWAEKRIKNETMQYTLF